jgi:hypothetical protein
MHGLRLDMLAGCRPWLLNMRGVLLVLHGTLQV